MKYLAPILAQQCPSLQWCINPERSALENFQSLATGILTLRDEIANRNANAKDHEQIRSTLLRALAELGTNLRSIEVMQKLASRPAALETNNSFEAKSDEAVMRELLALATNEPRLRDRAHTYQEAWEEVEGEYFLKMSIYRIESERRQKLHKAVAC